MRIEEYIPSGILKPFIKSYRIIESRHELVNRVVPSTSFALVFRFRGQISYINQASITTLPGTIFSGLRKSVRLINYAADTGAFIVLFNDTGASAFFRYPLHELYEESVSLDNFFPQSEILMVEDQIGSTENNRTKIDIIERFLYSKLICQKPDHLVSQAIAKIYANNGMIRMRDLAADLYISQDAFEKRFRKVTGTTPKQFSSIVRMNAIIRQTPSSHSFLNLALENGYYDHSHFNKDFKLFTGQTPTKFFRSAVFW
ncbi:MAG TPA: helix-turn-helix domain-containing protein [Sphingobacteriaceae bacterium]